MLHIKSFSLFIIWLTISVPIVAQSVPGYDVFLLVGQSNMVGYGTGADNATDAAANPRVLMWDANNSVISPAMDPLVQNQQPGFVGLGLTFAKAYLASLDANRKVLLVGSATGNTSFASGRWQAPNGDLANTAISRANAAMVAAGPGARFAGILWHQGESDYATDPTLYAGYLQSLIAFFRTHINGATDKTPFVVGEWTYEFMTQNIRNNVNVATQAGVIQDFHALPDRVNNTAWVSSVGLLGDTDQWEFIHFSALSQRQLGRRYADRFFEAASGLPQPETSMKVWGGFWDDGRSYNDGVIPVNFGAAIAGNVNGATDAAHGYVAQITGAQGYITYQIPSNTFNGSYTKMAWFKPGAPGYLNNLIGAVNPGQSHFLAASTMNGVLSVEAGHSDGSSIGLYIYQPIAATSGGWMNICLVYDAAGKTMTLFVNGAQVTTVANVPPAPALSGAPVPVTMGSYGSTPGTGIDGLMEGNRVWTSALTADQINKIYEYELKYRAGW